MAAANGSRREYRRPEPLIDERVNGLAMRTQPGTITARVNPLWVLVLMAFPLIWVIGLSVSFASTGDPAEAAAGIILFVAPVLTIILNSFLLYRLELTRDEIRKYRFLRWGTQRIPITELSAVVVAPGRIGAPQIAFQRSGRDVIRLMWRGGINFWPPKVLAKMLDRLAAQGVRIDEAVWSYLRNDARRSRPTLTRSAALMLVGFIFATSLAVSFALVAALAGFAAAGLTMVIIVLGYAAFYGVWWVIAEWWYGDLSPSAAHSSYQEPTQAGEMVAPMPRLRYFGPAYLLVTFVVAAGTGWLQGDTAMGLIVGGALAASGAAVLAAVGWARRSLHS